MSLGTANRDGGKTSESGHLRSIMKGYLGQVLGGLNVSQRGAGANMSVDIAIGDAIIPRSDGTYGHPAFNDAVLNQVITTADPSNPRRDILVMYIDYANAVSTGVSNNTNGVVKVKVVAGTPAGSPVDPTNAAIQSSVGASNPYIKLSRIRVGTGVTTIGNSVIDDLRVMASGMLQAGWNYDAVNPWVYVSATSFKIAGLDATAQFPVGTKIQLYQGSVVAYFVVTAAVFSTDTTVTVSGGGVYTLANNIIDRPAYSYDEVPQGFPMKSISDPNEWYQEIGRTTLAAPGNTISLQNLPAKKYLKIIVAVIDSGSIQHIMRFNNDSGANYARRDSTNGAADGSGANVTECLIPNAAANPQFAIWEVINILAVEKLVWGQAISRTLAGAGSIPGRHEIGNKWANTAAQITRVDIINISGGTFATGSEVVILGHD